MKDNILVISDVDGCLTDGTFIYTADGKVAKVYGPHDADGVKLLKKRGIEVLFISADKRGFSITQKRINDMGCEVILVSESERADFLKKYVTDDTCVVFFGDGISDADAANSAQVDCFVVPQNGRIEARRLADYVTPSIGGQGAFLDLALYILNNFTYKVV